MNRKRIALLTLIGVAGLGVAACNDGYGYSGVAVGYGPGGYYDGYGPGYWGWSIIIPAPGFTSTTAIVVRIAGITTSSAIGRAVATATGGAAPAAALRARVRLARVPTGTISAAGRAAAATTVVVTRNHGRVVWASGETGAPGVPEGGRLAAPPAGRPSP